MSKPLKTSRRAFLGTTAAVALGATAATTVTTGCSSVPAVEFPAGNTTDVAVGSRKFDEENNIWLVHSAEGFAAISAVCTHLSCVVSEEEGGDGFECGCHGSRFAPDGAVAEGPASDPLSWYAVRIDGGSVFVDGGKSVPAGTWVQGQVR